MVVYFRPIYNKSPPSFPDSGSRPQPLLHPYWHPPLAVSMASKLNPNILYVAEHGEALGSPQADSERTSMVSERPAHMLSHANADLASQ